MNKSEELCKLLGIKPEVRPSFDNSIICTSDLRQFYPDLTKPSNFVKLLEMHFYCFEYVNFNGVGMATGYDKNLKEELISKFISYFSPNGNKVSELGRIINLDFIKQQAQQIEWDY